MMMMLIFFFFSYWSIYCTVWAVCDTAANSRWGIHCIFDEWGISGYVHSLSLSFKKKSIIQSNWMVSNHIKSNQIESPPLCLSKSHSLTLSLSDSLSPFLHIIIIISPGYRLPLLLAVSTVPIPILSGWKEITADNKGQWGEEGDKPAEESGKASHIVVVSLSLSLCHCHRWRYFHPLSLCPRHKQGRCYAATKEREHRSNLPQTSTVVGMGVGVGE